MVRSASEPNMVFVALIGDVEASRTAPDRAALQRRLETALQDVSGAMEEDAVAPLDVTGGDEFQGLYRSASAAVRAMVQLSDAMHPWQLHFGLGLGRIETRLADRVARMDGPCFHRAREGLEQAQARGRWARLAGWGTARDEAVANALLGLVGAVRSSWTQTQSRYVMAARHAPTQKAVAERFAVSPSVVSESLKAARYRVVREAEDSVSVFLDERMEVDR